MIVSGAEVRDDLSLMSGSKLGALSLLFTCFQACVIARHRGALDGDVLALPSAYSHNRDQILRLRGILRGHTEKAIGDVFCCPEL